jgi:hypothetical protein
MEIKGSTGRVGSAGSTAAPEILAEFQIPFFKDHSRQRVQKKFQEQKRSQKLQGNTRTFVGCLKVLQDFKGSPKGRDGVGLIVSRARL